MHKRSPGQGEHRKEYIKSTWTTLLRVTEMGRTILGLSRLCSVWMMI